MIKLVNAVDLFLFFDIFNVKLIVNNNVKLFKIVKLLFIRKVVVGLVLIVFMI